MLPEDPTTIIVLLVLIALVSVARNIVEIAQSFRRKPSVDRDLQDYMPRKEIEGHFRDIRAEDTKIWQRLNGIDSTNSKERADIQRALGRVEGKLDKLTGKI